MFCSRQLLTSAFSRVLAAALLLLAARSFAQPLFADVPLTNAMQVRDLTAPGAERKVPVRIRGVVTYFDVSWGMLFVQDETAGVFVGGFGPRIELKAGQIVQLRGVTGPGSYSPFVAHPNVTILGTAELPPARVLKVQELRGQHDGLRVEVQGTVGRAALDDNRLLLELADGNSWTRTWILDPPRTWEMLVNARVRVRGVAAASLRDDKSVQMQIFVPDASQLVVEESAPPNLFARPVESIAHVAKTTPAGGRTVRIQGAVQQITARDRLWLRDSNAAIRINDVRTNSIQPGTLIDLVGWLSRTNGETVVRATALRRFGLIATNDSWPITPDSSSNVITSVARIRALKPSDAAREFPVRIQGVVSYHDDNEFFFHDGEFGIYVGMNQKLDLAVGDWIQLEGITAPGNFAPIIINPRFTPIARAPLPSPRNPTAQELNSGSQDSQWVRRRGIVQSAKLDGGYLTLVVAEIGGQFEAYVPNVSKLTTNFVDAEVRLTGACGTIFNQKRQSIGTRMFVPHLDCITLERVAPAGPFELPIQAIDSLLQFTTGQSLEHRVHVRGIVTLNHPGKLIYVQDETGGIEVHANSHSPLSVGDEVDVAGFPAMGGYTPVLLQAEWRKTGWHSPPRPPDVTADQALSADFSREVFDSRLVRLRGRILDLTTRSKEKLIVVQDGDLIFNAQLEDTNALPSSVRPGAIVELTGVCNVQVDTTRYPKSFRLLMRSRNDLRIVQPASWWTMRHTFALAGIMTGVIAAVVGWVLALRKRVRSQTSLIERRLAREQALEARYRELFENNPHPMWVYHRQTFVILAVNEAAVLHYGYSREEFLTLKTQDLNAKGAPPEPAANSEPQRRDASFHKKKNGDVIAVEISTHALSFGGKDANLILVTDVTERQRAEAELLRAQKELLELSRQAGMAEVATSVLHNVGNVLNSVNVSTTIITDQVRESKVGMVPKVAALLEEAARNPAFLVEDERGRQLPGYVQKLSEHLAREQKTLLAEVQSLRGNIEHIKDIVAMQQSYARVGGVTEIFNVTDVVEHALRMNSGSLLRHDIDVHRDFRPVPEFISDKHKVLQILVNLIRNAKHACDDSGRLDKRITVRVRNGDDRVRVVVEDNGVGIPSENLNRIFNHGFTTRKNGHGFGLHSGALAAQQLGGSLHGHSDGPGHGAQFTLELPLKR